MDNELKGKRASVFNFPSTAPQTHFSCVAGSVAVFFFLLQMSCICEMSKEFGFTMTMFLVSAD